MSASTEITERIKKLLRLARSANPHEAALALQRALALAREHGIAVESLNPDEQAKEKCMTHRDAEECRRMSYDARYAAVICKRFFKVSTVEVAKLKIIRDWPTRVVAMTFVGTTADVEIAVYVYHFLKHHFAFCWRKHRGRLRNRAAFVFGMLEGLYRKLEDGQPVPEPREVKGNELAPCERTNYIAAVIGATIKGDITPRDNDAHAARNAGFIHGQKTNIAPALRPSEEPAPLALRG